MILNFRKKSEDEFGENPNQSAEVKPNKELIDNELSKIYHYETIDPSSVRPIGKKVKKNESAQHSNVKTTQFPIRSQLQLDYGPRFTGELPSFRLSEAITSLSLSPQAYQALLAQEKRVLKDVLETPKEQWISLKGMGQGHVDEILHELNKYLGSTQSIYLCPIFDAASFLRVCLGNGLEEKHFLVLDDYSLSDLFPKNQQHGFSFKSFQNTSKQDSKEEGIQSFKNGKIAIRVKTELARVMDAYIFPWLNQRLGFEKESAMFEHLIHMSENIEETRKVFSFLQDVFFEGKSLFSPYFERGDKSVFTLNPYQHALFKKSLKQAKSYFYKRGLSYPLDDLLLYMKKESLKKWFAYPAGFLEKMFRLSSAYHLYRKEDDRLWVSAS